MSSLLRDARRRLRACRSRRKLEKERFPRIKPKRKGTIRTLAVWQHHYNWENEALKPSLERFGPVRFYDWFEEFDHSRKDWSHDLKPRMNRFLVDLVDSGGRPWA